MKVLGKTKSGKNGLHYAIVGDAATIVGGKLKLGKTDAKPVFVEKTTFDKIKVGMPVE